MIADLLRRVRSMVSVAEIHRTEPDTIPRQAQATLGAHETLDRVHHLQHFGFASRPPKGSRGVVLSVTGDRAQPVLVAEAHRDHLGPPLSEGESALFGSGDPFVVVGDDGVEISGDTTVAGDLAATGDVADHRSTLEQIRALFDAHVHSGPGTPPTDPMIPGGGGAGEPESSYLEAGNGPPDPSLERVPGSRWVDVESGDVWVRKDEWELEGASLRGETGDPGSLWYGSHGAPSPGLGKPTDWHLDLSSGDVRTKSALGWVFLGNIKGAQGEQGPTGPPGTTDHGAQTGLLDDDHPQYLLADGARTATTLNVTGDVSVGGLVDGRDVDVDGTKLDQFALGSTARQRLVWNANESRWDAELDRVKVQKFVANYVGPSGGVWTVQVLASEHGLGFDVEVRAWDTSSIPGSRVAFGAHELSVNAAGDITLKVSVAPDGRRDVLFVVSRTL